MRCILGDVRTVLFWVSFSQTIIYWAQTQHKKFDFITTSSIITIHIGDFMSSRTFNNEAKLKLTQLINEGLAVTHANIIVCFRV